MSAPKNLIRIRPGVTLAAPAAHAFRRLEARWGRTIDVNRSLADWDTQYALWRHWIQTGRPPFALHPDKSMHCKGLAIDSDDHVRVGFVKLAAEYGWKQSALAVGEPWHFDYLSSTDKHKGEPAGGGSQPIPEPEPKKEDDMLRVRSESSGNWYVIYATSVTSIKSGVAGSPEHARAKAYSDALGEPFVILPSATVQSLLNDLAARQQSLSKLIEGLIADEQAG